MLSVKIQHHRRRAIDFVEGMRHLKDDLDGFRYSSALLGIHGAISYCDALRIGLGSHDLSSDNHGTAASELKSLLSDRKVKNSDGSDRLKKLLSRKSRIAYSGAAPDRSEIVTIIQDAERFAAWAEGLGKELRIEGWAND
jgi:hypothetical protein